MITTFEKNTAIEACRILQLEKGKRIFAGEIITQFLEYIILEVFMMSDSPYNTHEGIRNQEWDEIIKEINKIEIGEVS